MKLKIFIFTILIVLIGALSFWYYKKHHLLDKAYKQETIIVEAQQVRKGNIDIEAIAVGTLVAAKHIEIAPEIEGKVAAILVNDGDFVKENQPLIQLDDAVNKAKAESAKANFVFSEANYKRMIVLGKKGAVTQQAIDQALANLEEKKALAKESQALVENMLLKAPFSGVLSKIRINLGETISAKQPIVNLTDIHHLRVEYSIPEKYLSLLKQGQQVSLTTSALPGKNFYGKVAFISPMINTQDRTIAVYADVPNEDKVLTPGLFMNVVHLLGSENNALLIPSQSLVATLDGQQVFKIVDNKAVAVPINLGQRTENQVQILGGLQLSDWVVTSGQHKIKEGTPVKMKS